MLQFWNNSKYLIGDKYIPSHYLNVDNFYKEMKSMDENSRRVLILNQSYNQYPFFREEPIYKNIYTLSRKNILMKYTSYYRFTFSI